MDELVFMGSLVLLLVLAIVLAKIINHTRSGRKPDHPVHLYSPAKKAKSRHEHTPLYSHTQATERFSARHEIWRTSRVKASEAHWQPEQIIANKILTDSELNQKGFVTKAGSENKSVDYYPVDAGSGSKTVRV